MQKWSHCSAIGHDFFGLLNSPQYLTQIGKGKHIAKISSADRTDDI